MLLQVRVFMAMLWFSVVQPVQDKSAFTLVKEEKGIKLFERWVPLAGKPGLEARELKTEFTVNASPAAVIALIRDDKRASQWQKNLAEYTVYRQADTLVWHAYARHKIPWPVNDQDHYVQYKLAHSARLHTIAFESIDSKRHPPYENVTRLILRGRWQIERLGAAQSKITYMVASNPLDLPRPLTDPIVRDNMIRSMRALADLLSPSSSRDQN